MGKKNEFDSMIEDLAEKASHQIISELSRRIDEGGIIEKAQRENETGESAKQKGMALMEQEIKELRAITANQQKQIEEMGEILHRLLESQEKKKKK